jgi:nucleoside 2-deoxyribosyltransferase
LVACGYEKPFRVDDPEHQADADKPSFQLKIDDRIIAGIRQARFVVVDVTGQRCAVYYEAGFAEGLGTPVIWTCRKDVPEHMNFDTRQKEHILWTDPLDLATQLEMKIRARGWTRGT